MKFTVTNNSDVYKLSETETVSPSLSLGTPEVSTGNKQE